MSAVHVHDDSITLADISKLEKEFVEVELAALRHKEFHLKPLYVKRKDVLSRIPGFWSLVFRQLPSELDPYFTDFDTSVLASLKDFSVERYQITSPTAGEPRSVRFTFHFDDNEFFADTKVVKEFEYQATAAGGGFVSTPVSLKWKSKKQDVTGGLLNAAAELYAAEQTMKLRSGDQVIDSVERESLWQYEKLREKLMGLEESPHPRSFFCWFAYRGVVIGKDDPTVEHGEKDGEEDGEEDNDDDDGLLDVEVFPEGGQLAIALADQVWPDVIDLFFQIHQEVADESDSREDDDEDAAPDLIPGADDRPAKRPRMS